MNKPWVSGRLGYPFHFFLSGKRSRGGITIWGSYSNELRFILTTESRRNQWKKNIFAIFVLYLWGFLFFLNKWMSQEGTGDAGVPSGDRQCCTHWNHVGLWCADDTKAYFTEEATLELACGPLGVYLLNTCEALGSIPKTIITGPARQLSFHASLTAWVWPLDPTV